MFPDRAYSLAFAFRKEKLWKHLYDTELFAVSLPNGEIGYCSVMGFLGEHLALALYVGSKGLDSYRRLLESNTEGMNLLKAQEIAFSQSCLQCSFECKDELTPSELSAARSYAARHGVTIRGANAYPQFLCYRPARYPCAVSRQKDIELICAALEAALAVSEKLEHTGKSQLGFQEGPAYHYTVPLLTPSKEGFAWSLHPLPPKQPVCYPEPMLQDELLAMRLKKAKKCRTTWMCDLVMLPQPYAEEETSSMVFPYTLVTAIRETGMALPMEIVSDPEGDAEKLLLSLGNQMLEHGIPKTIQVADERTCALLKNLAELLKIRLVLEPENECLEQLEEELLNHLGGQMPEPSEEELMDLIEILMAVDHDTLSSMPDELLERLSSFVDQGLLDADVLNRIQKLRRKKK